MEDTPANVQIRLDLVKEWAVRISDTLDAVGLNPHEQLMALRAISALALAALPPEERIVVRHADQVALDALADDTTLLPEPPC
jgi:hypothetical protein